MPLSERMTLLYHLRDVDEVIVHGTPGVVPDSDVLRFSVADQASPVDEPTVQLTPRRRAAVRCSARPRSRSTTKPSRDRGSAAPELVVGYVPGAWDVFHIGHLNILLRAREQCDRLIVGVVTDEALFAAKDKWPIVPLDERFEMMRNLDLVDDVVIDHSSNKLEVWQRVGFDVLFKGDDWRGTAKGYKLEQDMASVGVQVKYFPYTAHTSSSMLRSILADR